MTYNSHRYEKTIESIYPFIEAALSSGETLITELCDLSPNIQTSENPIVEAYLKIFFDGILRKVIVVPIEGKKEYWTSSVQKIFFPKDTFLNIEDNLVQITRQGIPFSFILYEKDSLIFLLEGSKNDDEILIQLKMIKNYENHI